MPFGLANALTTFQKYINKTLLPYIDVFCTTYLDNILTFSKTLEDHTQYVYQVLGLLQKANLQLKPQKCEFHNTSLEYLVILVTIEGLKMDPGEVSVVK
jgi:hypothetical protein